MTRERGRTRARSRAKQSPATSCEPDGTPPIPPWQGYGTLKLRVPPGWREGKPLRVRVEDRSTPAFVQACWITGDPTAFTKAARLQVDVPVGAQPGHLLLVRLPRESPNAEPTIADSALYASYSRCLVALLLPRVPSAAAARGPAEWRVAFSVAKLAHPPRDNEYGMLHQVCEASNVVPLVATRKGYDLQLRFALTVPEGAAPGMVFPVDADGALCRFRVPRGVKPGDAVHCAPTWTPPPGPSNVQEPPRATRRVVVKLPPEAHPGQEVTAYLGDGTPISFVVPQDVPRSRRLRLKVPAKDALAWGHPTGSLVASAAQLV